MFHSRVQPVAPSWKAAGGMANQKARATQASSLLSKECIYLVGNRKPGGF